MLSEQTEMKIMAALKSWMARLTEEEALILKKNEYSRLTEGVRDVEGLGRYGLTIPVDFNATLCRIYPELKSKDAKEKTNAWMAFMKSHASLPFRMWEKI